MEPKPNSSRIWWMVGLGLMVAWGLFLLLRGPSGGSGDLPPPQLESAEEGMMADYHWTLSDLDGKAVDFARYRGKAVFLNLWATTCPPCLAEMPAISNLARNPRLKGIAFVCVATDADPEAVRRFVREEKPAATILRAESAPDVFLTKTIPWTYVIASDGRIIVAHEGSSQWDAPEVVDFLAKLAAPPSRGPSRKAGGEVSGPLSHRERVRVRAEIPVASARSQSP